MQYDNIEYVKNFETVWLHDLDCQCQPYGSHYMTSTLTDGKLTVPQRRVLARNHNSAEYSVMPGGATNYAMNWWPPSYCLPHALCITAAELLVLNVQLFKFFLYSLPAIVIFHFIGINVLDTRKIGEYSQLNRATLQL